MAISKLLKAVLVAWGIVSLCSALIAFYPYFYAPWGELFPYLSSAIFSFGLAWVIHRQDNRP